MIEDRGGVTRPVASPLARTRRPRVPLLEARRRIRAAVPAAGSGYRCAMRRPGPTNLTGPETIKHADGPRAGARSAEGREWTLMTRGQGEGSIFYVEQRNRWAADLELSPDADGRRRRRRIFGRTRKEIAEKLQALQADAASGVDLVAGA